MPVFKAYLLVIKKNIPSLMIYFVVFVAMSVLFVNVIGGDSYSDFSAVKSSIIIISGEDTPFAEGFVEYLEENVALVSVGSDEQDIQDALFFGEADYVLTIPAGFTKSFLNGSDDVPLEKTTGALTSGTVSVDFIIGKYLELARLYVNNVPDISPRDIHENVMRDLQETAAVEVKTTEQQAQTSGLNDIFRYLAYPILGIMIMGITSIMLAFNKREVSKRNSCAPLGSLKINMQLFAGNALFTIVVWILLCLIALVMHKSFSPGPGAWLLCFNALFFSAVALSIGFLAGQFIKSTVAQAALTNVVSLGAAFISGIFIPQYILGETVLKISSFLPFYWYVKAVDSIGELSSYTYEHIRPVLGYFLIQLGFAAAFFIIALVISKQKKLEQNS